MSSLREEFYEAYLQMPENYERVSRSVIADWWINTLTEKIEGMVKERNMVHEAQGHHPYEESCRCRVQIEALEIFKDMLTK